MSDLIKRGDAIDEIRKECQALHILGFIPLATVGDIVDAVNHAPTIEPKHGKNLKSDYPSLFKCSVCGASCDDTIPWDCDINFCPNCGADMREVRDE